MLGKIGIEKLKIMTVIGVHAHERTDKQPLLIDLKVEIDISRCVIHDSFSDALNYELLREICEEIAESHSFHLIESFAASILNVLQLKFPHSRLWIKVSKPQAFENAIAAFVEMES